MSYYDNGSWSPAGRQAPWEPSPPVSRPGNTPTGSTDDGDAFYYQFAGVDRAVETWRKGGKLPNAKEPRVPMAPRAFPPTEFEPMRPMSGGNVQNFYASQRFGPRPGEVDPAVQAKRRMAAQRERDLRNYHQEQQFQKHLSGAKSDRSMSPNTGMSEDERRDLIARQHRALYGTESNMYTPESSSSNPLSPDVRVSGGSVPPGFRGASPYDAFGMQPGGPGNAPGSAVMKPQRDDKDGGAGAGAGQGQRSRANSTSSPASNQNTSSYNTLFDTSSQQQQQQQSSRTSTSSPGESPPRNASAANASAPSKPPTSNSANVAPIGTRPAASQQQQQQQQQQPNGPQPGGLQKRSTTPLPSPLSYGFSAATGTVDPSQADGGAAVQSQEDQKINSAGGSNLRSAWGNSGVWGGKGGLGVQAKVWG